MPFDLAKGIREELSDTSDSAPEMATPRISLPKEKKLKESAGELDNSYSLLETQAGRSNLFPFYARARSSTMA